MKTKRTLIAGALVTLVGVVSDFTSSLNNGIDVINKLDKRGTEPEQPAPAAPAETTRPAELAQQKPPPVDTCHPRTRGIRCDDTAANAAPFVATASAALAEAFSETYGRRVDVQVTERGAIAFETGERIWNLPVETLGVSSSNALAYLDRNDLRRRLDMQIAEAERILADCILRFLDTPMPEAGHLATACYEHRATRGQVALFEAYRTVRGQS